MVDLLRQRTTSEEINFIERLKFPIYGGNLRKERQSQHLKK